jgi:hypothetical protein
MHLLWLDFDGVLWEFPRKHNSDDRGIEVLAEALEPYSQVKIVLSTSWSLTLGVKGAQRLLPKELALRVVGSTFDDAHLTKEEFLELPRWQQILDDVKRRNPQRWIALDDDVEGWPGHAEPHLLSCSPELGLRCLDTQARLKIILAAHFSEPS